MKVSTIALAVLAFLAWPVWAMAASIRVAPTSLTLTSPANAGTFTLRNDGELPINVQVRPFRWRQQNGRDELEPTRDIVASPPMHRLEPGVDYVVRIVRLAKSTVASEEAYRLLIDELPDPARRRNGNVSMLLRYSVPLFFTRPAAVPADIAWHLEQGRDGIRLSASNYGERHLRVSNLKIRLPGQVLPVRDGLVGYVLGRSQTQWTFPVRLPALAAREIELSGETSEGGFNVAVAVGNAR
jgi:fimbrial chaperone protein